MTIFLDQLIHALEQRATAFTPPLNDAGHRLLGRVIAHRYECCVEAGEGAAADEAVLLLRLKAERVKHGRQI